MPPFRRVPACPRVRNAPHESSATDNHGPRTPRPTSRAYPGDDAGLEDFTEQANQQFISRIDGNSTGTTEEIRTWGAVKCAGRQRPERRSKKASDRDKTVSDKSNPPRTASVAPRHLPDGSFGIMHSSTPPCRAYNEQYDESSKLEQQQPEPLRGMICQRHGSLHIATSHMQRATELGDLWDNVSHQGRSLDAQKALISGVSARLQRTKSELDRRLTNLERTSLFYGAFLLRSSSMTELLEVAPKQVEGCGYSLC